MGPICVVTGAQRGIGRGIATVLHARGYHVVLVDWDRAGVEAASRALAGSVAWTVDVRDFGAVQAAVAQIEEDVGPIYALVNNAGINRDRMLHRMSEEEWDAVLAVNLKGQFNWLRHVAPLLRERRAGRVVNIASMSWLGNVGQANYAASKAGVVGLTKTAARELAPFAVTVNAICPGFIDTPMTQAMPPAAWEQMMAKIPLGRIGTPEDVGKLVAFLVSEDAAYITGEVINVSGGMIL
jgi:NAD(P)-dependent dehydrogenase (short-subunit alcohol dehydrogenase family)